MPQNLVLLFVIVVVIISPVVMCLRSFLSRVKSHVHKLSQEKSKISPGVKYTFCVGNEAADADSIISCLSYSFVLDKFSQNKNTLIPLVLCPRSSMHLKREVELVLERTKLTLDDLVCFEEITNFSDLVASDSVDLVLLDHNVLSSSILSVFEKAQKEPNVLEIIDHHKDMGMYPKCVSNFRSIAFDTSTGLAGAGSSCSLVFNKYWESISNKQDIDGDVSDLLLSVILLDTHNMDPHAGKGTQIDQLALDRMNEVFHLDHKDLKNRYSVLQNAKTDITFWRGLSSQEAVDMDFKEFRTRDLSYTIGISSILLPLQDYFAKQGAVDCLANMLDTKNCSIASLMSYFAEQDTDVDGKSTEVKKRQLFLASKDEAILQRCGDYMNSVMELMPLSKSSLESIPFGNHDIFVLAFQQRDIKLSRKQVAPYLLSSLEE